MGKNFTSNKGITLIALVITIVVIMILATVSIAMIRGENGILNKSKQAKVDTEITEEIEALELSASLAQKEDTYGRVTETNLKNQLEQIIGNGKYILTLNGDKFKVTFGSGRMYNIDINGKVTEL